MDLPDECISNASSVKVYACIWITCLSLLSSSGIPDSLSVALLKSLYWRISCTSSGSPVLTASCKTAHTVQHCHHHRRAPMRFTEDAHVGRQGKALKGQWKSDTNDLLVWFQTCVRNINRDFLKESHGDSLQYNEGERRLGLSISKNEINIEVSACVVYSKIYHSSYVYMHPNNP